jgi:hypothetical protein
MRIKNVAAIITAVMFAFVIAACESDTPVEDAGEEVPVVEDVVEE